MALIKPLLKQVLQVQNVLYTTDWVASFIQAPPALKDHPFWQDRERSAPYIFSFMVNSISLPNLQAGSVELSLAGYRVRVPLEMPRIGELQMTFLEDQNVRTLEALLAWIGAIHDFRKNVRTRSPDLGMNAYKAAMDLYLHKHAASINKDGSQEVYLDFPVLFRFYGVWPTSMQLPELNSQKVGDILMVNASFSYDHFEVFRSSDPGTPL